MSKVAQPTPRHREPDPTRNIYQRTALPETGFVRLPAVLHTLGVGKSTWWAGVKSGRFPAAIRLGPRTTAWRAEDIRALVDELDNACRKAS
jgi:prophage regulatory protein